MPRRSGLEASASPVHKPVSRRPLTTSKLREQQAYDLVFNGFEIGGGSRRIYQREIQEQVFEAIGLSLSKPITNLAFC